MTDQILLKIIEAERTYKKLLEEERKSAEEEIEKLKAEEEEKFKKIQDFLEKHLSETRQSQIQDFEKNLEREVSYFDRLIEKIEFIDHSVIKKILEKHFYRILPL